MRKMVIVFVALIFVLSFASCSQESTSETDNLYGIDKEDVVPPGEKGGN